MLPNKALQLTRRRRSACQALQPSGGRSGGRFAGRPPDVSFPFTGGAQLSALSVGLQKMNSVASYYGRYARRSMKVLASICAMIALGALTAQTQQAPLPRNDQPGEPQQPKTPVVRERRVVLVNGSSEVWELRWASPPVLICPPDDIGSFTCPCDGFSFGESGDLDLVRTQGGNEIDRLSLTPLFSNQDTPAWGTENAVLQRWPVEKTDYEASDNADLQGAGQPAKFRAQVMKRKPVGILNGSEFNHDGWATEFVLQIGVLPCGKRQSILVGVSADRPRLHAFGTAEHPDTPLILYPDHWARLKTAKQAFRVVSWTCGD